MTAKKAKNAKQKSQAKDLKPRVVKGSKAASIKGGKATFHDMSFTHNVDKASPVL